MIIELLNQIRWQVLIFRRNNLLTMISGITAFYVLIIYLLKDLENVDKFITLLIYNDPAIVGFIFIGVSMILEKDQGILPALFVTPATHHTYLSSRIITLSTMGFIGAIALVIAAKGTAFNFIHFSIGAFSTCVLFSMMGVFVVSYTTEILHFLLRSVPLLIFMSLPLLNYFELTEWSVLQIFPVQGGLNLMINSFADSPRSSELIFGYVSLAVWTPLLYWLVYSTFVSRVLKV